MWHRAMVEYFLNTQKVSKRKKNAVVARMNGFVGADGMFPACGLKVALKDKALERRFVAAWNHDSTPFMNAKLQATQQ